MQVCTERSVIAILSSGSMAALSRCNVNSVLPSHKLCMSPLQAHVLRQQALSPVWLVVLT